MSSDSDLTSAFGRPARDLSGMLSPNPRRTRRAEAEEPPKESAEGHASPVPDRAAPGPPRRDLSDQGEADSSRERHLTAAPEAAEADRVPADPAAPAPAAYGTGGASGGTGTATRERPAPTRSRRAATGGRARGQARSANPAGLDPSTSYQVPVYVHPGVRVAATTKRKTEKLTNAEIAFNAIDEVQHRLAGLVRDRRLQARPDSSLFPDRVRRGRLGGGGAASTDGDARRVLWGFRATGAELEIIDRLADDCGAESRSELVAVALEETLLR